MIRPLILAVAALNLVACQSETEGAEGAAEGAARAAGDAVLSAGAAAVADAGPPEALQWIAVRDINIANDDDMNPTNRPPLVEEAPEGMIVPFRITSYDEPDWRINYEESGVNRWCGTGGCRQRLFAATPDGMVQVFDANALSITEVQGERPRMRIQVHHTYCGIDVDPDGCAFVAQYDPQSQSLVVIDGPADFEFDMLMLSHDEEE